MQLIYRRNAEDLIWLLSNSLAAFTALQLCSRGIAMSICPSVHPSVKRVNCDKTKQISADILIAYERSMHLVF